MPLHLRDVWDAFFALSRLRTVGFSSPNPIQLSEIKAYIELYDIVEVDIDEFVNLLTRLDGEFLAYMTRKPGQQRSGSDA